MAWTNSVIHQTVFGNKRTAILSCTADSAEAAINTGMGVVHGFAIGPVSLSTAAIKLIPNKGSTATALNGYLGASGFVSGDVFYLTVYGV
jgi:hypothetical protein